MTSDPTPNPSEDVTDSGAPAPEANDESTVEVNAAEESTENAAADPAQATPATPPPPAAEESAGEAAGESKKKIQIGRNRRDLQGNEITSSRPQLAGDAAVNEDLTPAPRRAEPVPTPSVRDPLSDDLQKEIDAALGGASIDEMMDAGTRSDVEIAVETKLRATVVRIDQENVFFSLGGRNQGVAPLRTFGEKPPEVGEAMEVIVSGEGADDGLFELAIPGSAVQVADWADLAEGTVVEARITGANTGGLECMVNNIRGFIPASQIAIFRVENFAEYINKKLTCVVTEANRRRKNLVLSHRAILEREKEESRKELMATLQVGQVHEGIVRSLRDFGAFVDLGGVDGLIHISQLSWERVEHPKDVLQENQKVSVRIEKIDPSTGKIGLSYRTLQEHPWSNISERFPTGSTVAGTVSRVAKFGAFVKLAAGVEGLVHISELAHEHVRQVGQVVQEGQEVEVKILSVDEENQRIGLSIKANIEKPAEPEAEEPEEEAAPRERPKRNTPLKGGLGGGSGGDQFGLKW